MLLTMLMQFAWQDFQPIWLALPSSQRHQLGFDLEGQFAHSYQVLRDLCESLFVLVNQELWPKLQMLIQLFKRFSILLLQAYFLPHVIGGVCTLNRLHVQVYSAIFFPYSCISAVG